MSAGGEHLKDEGSKQQVLIAGGVAGLISRFCIAPLDVIKIRLQLQTYPLSRRLNVTSVTKVRGALPLIKSILYDEGIRGFWRGNLPAELLYITYGSLQFTTYHTISTLLTSLPLPTTFTTFTSGAVAGATATTLTYPLDLLRTRFAAQGPNPVYKSFFFSFRDIVRAEGMSGLFQGLGAGVGQIVPYMGLFFSVYEGLRPLAAGLELPFGSGDAGAGVLASVIAKTGVFPLDLIRKRLQVQGPVRERFAGGAVPAYGRGVWRTGRLIMGREGWRGLYRGLGVGLLKAAPASAVTMWTYEHTLKTLGEWRIG